MSPRGSAPKKKQPPKPSAPDQAGDKLVDKAGDKLADKAAGKPTEADARAAQKRDERRAQLVAAAREIFGEKGYHEATVDDITKRAGVAKGTFYLYFAEKKEIYYDLVRTFFQRITDIGASVAVEINSVPEFYARIEKAAMRLFQTFAEHHAVARLAYRESASLDPTLEKMLRDFYRQMALLEAENLRVGIRLGVFRKVDPIVTAYAHIGMVERVALGLLREPSAPPAADVIRELLSIAYLGLKPRSGDKAEPAAT